MHRATRRLRKTLLLGLGVLSLCSVLTSKGKTEEAPYNTKTPINVIWFPDNPYALDQGGIPTGFEIDLWRMIAESRQIPYRIKRADSFKGMLESVSSGESDLAIGGILINENRSKKFDYTFPTSTSGMKIYTVNKEPSAAIKVLQVLLSRESLLIFGGLILITGFFAIPVWLLEKKDRRKILAPGTIHELIYVLQKTLLLSTDHTKRTTTRVLSMTSLFARVILTAYFASYILKLTNNESLNERLRSKNTLNLSNISKKTFVQYPGSIQASMLESRGIKMIDCNITEECIDKLANGEANAILGDIRTMETTLNDYPTEVEIKAASPNLMALFVAFGMSKKFSQNDPRSTAISDGIARSYYDGSHAELSRKWSLLKP